MIKKYRQPWQGLGSHSVASVVRGERRVQRSVTGAVGSRLQRRRRGPKQRSVAVSSGAVLDGESSRGGGGRQSGAAATAWQPLIKDAWARRARHDVLGRAGNPRLRLFSWDAGLLGWARTKRSGMGPAVCPARLLAWPRPANHGHGRSCPSPASPGIGPTPTVGSCVADRPRASGTGYDGENGVAEPRVAACGSSADDDCTIWRAIPKTGFAGRRTSSAATACCRQKSSWPSSGGRRGTAAPSQSLAGEFRKASHTFRLGPFRGRRHFQGSNKPNAPRRGIRS